MNKFEKMWYMLAICIVVASCVVSGSGILVSTISVVGILFVLGVAMKQSYSQLLGAVFCGLLAYASITAGFIASGVVNVLLIPVCIWGYYTWESKAATGVEKSLTTKQVICYTMVASILVVLVSIFTVGVSSLPILDALTAILPIAATLLMVQGYREQWKVWIPYNALQAFMWFSAASLNPAVLSLFILKLVFLINSVIGYYNWKTKKIK